MIAIGCDHGGFELKEHLLKYLKDNSLEVKDFGAYNDNSVDYPDIAKLVCEDVAKGNSEFGILICGTGIGMSMAANKINGIRCALLSDEYSAKMTKRHNNANVVALGGRVLGRELAFSIIDAFMSTDFECGRHQRRIDKIHNLED